MADKQENGVVKNKDAPVKNEIAQIFDKIENIFFIGKNRKTSELKKTCLKNVKI